MESEDPSWIATIGFDDPYKTELYISLNGDVGVSIMLPTKWDCDDQLIDIPVENIEAVIEALNEAKKRIGPVLKAVGK